MTTVRRAGIVVNEQGSRMGILLNDYNGYDQIPGSIMIIPVSENAFWLQYTSIYMEVVSSI